MTAMTALNLGESLREFVEAAIVGHEAVRQSSIESYSP